MRKTKDKKIEVREIVYSQDDEKSFGDVFIYEPENIEEQNLGNLFIVGELKDLPRNCSYIMNVLASKIKKEFYSNTKRTAEESLEAGLAEANKTLADLAEQGNGEYVSKLSMVCGTYHGSRFFLSQIGKIRSLLLRGGQIVEIVKEDGRKSVSPKRAFNNIASGELSDGDMVMFASSGLFNIFSTEQLRQYGGSMNLNEFSAKLQEEIEEEDSETVSALLIEIEGDKKALIERSEITTQKEKETAEESLEKALAEGVPMEVEMLSEEGDEPAASMADVEIEQETGTEEEEAAKVGDVSPALEITTLSEAGDGSEEKQEEAAPDERASEYPEEKKEVAVDIVSENEEEEESPAPEISVAKETAATIEAVQAKAAASSAAGGYLAAKASGKISLSDIIKEYEKLESRKFETQPDGEKEKNIEEMIVKKETASFEDLDEEEGSVSQKITYRAKSMLSSIVSGISKAGLGRKLKNAVKSEKEYKIDRGGKRFSLGSKKVLVAIAVIIIAVGGYSYYSTEKKEEERAIVLGKYQSMLDDSKSKMEEAEVEIISGSEENAGRLYMEARALAMQVRDEYDMLDADADTVIATAQAEIDKIDKVVKADNPFVIANFENENIGSFVEASGTYYVVDGMDKTLYEVNTETKVISQIAKTEESVGNLAFAKNLQSVELLLSDGSSFLSYSLKNGKLDKLDAGTDADFVDFATYGRYVYLLSPADDQIYKYQKSTGGLENKTPWLKGSDDISGAVSLAIDQNIFVLSSDGGVKKYYTGEEYRDENGNAFAIKQPLDPLANPTKIYTSTDQAYLYVLEPSKQRVVIFDKTTGAFVKQVVNKGIAEVKDFFVDAEEQNMAVLTKDKIMNIYLGE